MRDEWKGRVVNDIPFFPRYCGGLSVTSSEFETIEMEKIYTRKEERINTWSHGAGILLFSAGTVLLLIKALDDGSVKAFIAFLVYGTGVTAMYLASTLYHSSTNPVRRKRLKVLDHSAIFLTIAGSYTPITLLTIPPDWGIPLLIIVWLIAAGGILLKLFFIGKHSKLSTAMYVLMGWVIVVAVKPLINSMVTAGLIWLLAGGLTYTAGALLYQLKSLPYNHAVFHFFVLIGSICHYVVMYCYCIH
jgi:hemolysin III